MSEVKKEKKPHWVRRIFIGLVLLLFVLALLVLGLRWWITTDGGSNFLESQIENRQLGPIKRVEIDGLSGDPLDVITLKGLRVYDREGLWLTASDIKFDWSPWPLRNRHLVVEDLDIARLEVLRTPVLEEAEAGEPFTAQFNDADISALVLGEAILGQAAILKVDAQGGLLEGGAVEVVLSAIRTDAAGDEINLDFKRAPNGDMTGAFEIYGQPGGTIATLLRAPVGRTVSGQGAVNGTIDTGAGNAVITFGEARAIDTNINWSQEAANVEAELNTNDWGIFDSSRRFMGETLNVTANLNRTVTPQAFTASATSVNVKAYVSGELPEAGGLPSAVDFNVSSKTLSAILPMPEGYTFGAGSAKGRVQMGDIISGRADINITNVNSPYGRADRLTGPISVSPVGKAYRLVTNLRAVAPVTTAELPLELGPDAVLKLKGLFNPETEQVTELDASLSSGGNITTAKGRLAFDTSQLDLNGQVQANLKAIGTAPPGAINTSYSASRTATSDLAVSAAGEFRPESTFAEPLGGLIGDVLNFDIDMTPVEGGARLRNSLVSSDGFKLAAEGRITDTLDLSAEIAVSRPVTVAALDITAPSQFSATITGPRADPALRLDGTLEAATLAGQNFENIRLRTELTALLSAPKGPVRLTADTIYGPLDLEARLASTEAGYAVDDLDLMLANLSVGGDLALDPDNIATGQLVVNLPEEGDRYARATLDLANISGEQGVTLKADAKNIIYKTYAIETLSLNAAGTLAALTGEVSLDGRTGETLLTREFGLDTPLTLTRTPDNAYRLVLEPDADYGRYQLGHSEAVALEYQAGKIGLAAPLTLNGKPFALNYTSEAGAETLKIQSADLPIDLVPLPGNLGETRGRVSIDVDAKHGGSGQLSGQGVIKVTDWRGFDFKKGEGFTTALTLDLQSQSVGWRLGAEDSANLKIEGNGSLPIMPGESLMAIRPNMTAPMQGRLDIQGSAKPLLSLMSAEEAEPEGRLEARLDVGGTLGSPRIEGQANGKELRYELPELGTRLRNGRFTANFTNDTIDVTDVYVRDSKKGTLEGSGNFKLGEYAIPLGRLDIKAKKFIALDRKDYEGTVSGTLFFESEKEAATLGGDVTVKKAEVKQFVAGRVAVVEIEVEEINGSMGDIAVQKKVESAPIKLDLRVRAPRNIFVRTRGLDVELELDVALKGTVSEPELFGEANVRRGGYRIAGKELQFTEGSIEFSGSLADAKVNLKAETDTQNISASVEITGTVEDPKIDLTSTPERPQDEILSALLFGRSVTELSTIEAAQLAGALAQFSGAGGGFDLMGGLRDALGVGQLSIGVGEDGQASFSGGRYLAKDVYLQIFTGAGPDSTGAVLDWELRKNLSLRSRVQSDNEQSLTLKYKKDF